MYFANTEIYPYLPCAICGLFLASLLPSAYSFYDANLNGRQLVVMGNASLILGSFLGVLVLVPNPLSGHLLSAGVSATILLIGVALKRRGNVIERQGPNSV
ncbi:MAG: hypothetical protein ACI8V2_004508 [Candidatus Latescibacterota bacterium]|jgi:hypothetical protein